MSDVRDPNRDQPLPIPTGGPSMHDLVAADLAERKAHGLRKYGALLQTGNGRSFTRDAYEEEALAPHPTRAHSSPPVGT